MSTNVKHKVGVLLYEAMVPIANEENKVSLSLEDIATKAKLTKHFQSKDGTLSGYQLRKTLEYLRQIGSVQMFGNRVKILIGHPNAVSTDTDATTVTFAEPAPSAKISAEEAIAEIPPHVLADSIARKMWERYEWALNEVGRVHGLLETKDREIARLRLIIEVQEPVTAADAARLMLSAKK